ncbi:hypothetical protein LOAG_17165 [Loa loa]|uniref:Uncharacterized protein n=1 Tax=Loa loa TaxID=7209 RepID=A0A1S0ULU1_LOALO|nr:hypothetical protein LOAG_17165 [Loa loa]EJD75754.1 hypothetical protein LOAG_17165 [Loa loa]
MRRGNGSAIQGALQTKLPKVKRKQEKLKLVAAVAAERFASPLNPLIAWWYTTLRPWCMPA